MQKMTKVCGSCLHLEKEKTFDKPCIQLGKIPTSKQCGSYHPNMHMIVSTEDKYNRVEQIALALAGMQEYEIQAFAGVLESVKKTRKHGYSFFERVFVRYTGTGSANYVSNFMSCRVLYADKDYVRLISESGKSFLTLMNEKDGVTIIKVKVFVEMRREMLANRKYVDPKEKRLTLTSQKGEITTLDEVVRQDKMTEKIRKGVSKAKDDPYGRIAARMLKSNGRKHKKVDREEIQM